MQLGNLGQVFIGFVKPKAIKSNYTIYMEITGRATRRVENMLKTGIKTPDQGRVRRGRD